MSSSDETTSHSPAPNLREDTEAELETAESAEDTKRLASLEGIHEKLSRALEGEEDQAGSPRQ